MDGFVLHHLFIPIRMMVADTAMEPIGNFAISVFPCGPGQSVGMAIERLQIDLRLPGLPVVDADGRLIALLGRERLLTLGSGRFGFSLIRDRSIASLLDDPAFAPPPVCDADDPVETVAARLVGDATKAEGVVACSVTKAGRYHGLVPHGRLLGGLLLRTRAQAADLIRARDAALEAGTAKSAFLSNMSHEIRTPMTAILGFTDLLLDSHLDEQQQDMLLQVRSAGKALLGLINDILDISKVEAGMLQLMEEPFDPSECLREVRDLFLPQAREKGLALHLEVVDLPNDLLGDPLRLRQILCNLVGNALKFTDQGRIDLGCRHLNDQPGICRLEFSVSDTGPGISPEVQERLFQPFVQGDPGLSRRHGGTGLGLAIVAQLVRLMGGRTILRSHPGLGSTFAFIVPFRLHTPTGRHERRADLVLS